MNSAPTLSRPSTASAVWPQPSLSSPPRQTSCRRSQPCCRLQCRAGPCLSRACTTTPPPPPPPPSIDQGTRYHPSTCRPSRRPSGRLVGIRSPFRLRRTTPRCILLVVTDRIDRLLLTLLVTGELQRSARMGWWPLRRKRTPACTIA